MTKIDTRRRRRRRTRIRIRRGAPAPAGNASTRGCQGHSRRPHRVPRTGSRTYGWGSWQRPGGQRPARRRPGPRPYRGPRLHPGQLGRRRPGQHRPRRRWDILVPAGAAQSPQRTRAMPRNSPTSTPCSAPSPSRPSAAPTRSASDGSSRLNGSLRPGPRRRRGAPPRGPPAHRARPSRPPHHRRARRHRRPLTRPRGSRPARHREDRSPAGSAERRLVQADLTAADSPPAGPRAAGGHSGAAAARSAHRQVRRSADREQVLRDPRRGVLCRAGQQVPRQRRPQRGLHRRRVHAGVDDLNRSASGNPRYARSDAVR